MSRISDQYFEEDYIKDTRNFKTKSKKDKFRKNSYEDDWDNKKHRKNKLKKSNKYKGR